MEAELIGRDEELQRAQQFLEAVQTGARTLLIAGDAGVGKTSLWEAALSRAHSAGLQALVARPTEAETSFAYAALGDLLGAHPEVLADLPSPQRRALEIVLRMVERGEPPDQQTVALATLAALRTLGREVAGRPRCRRRAVARPANFGGARLRRAGAERTSRSGS